MRRGVRAVAAALLAALVCAAAAQADPRVTRDGPELVYKGKPYRFTGINVYNANNRADCWYPMPPAVLAQSFRDLGTGVDVMRSWFFQRMATRDGARDWTAFDETLAVARKAGVKVVATLANQWGDCEPEAGYRTAGWYGGGYASGIDPGGTASYRDYVAEFTRRYRNDATILAIELVNEPEVKTARDGECGFAASSVLEGFAADVSSLVKSIDSRRLVSLGVIGSGQCGASYTEYYDVHDVPGIDLCSYHDYTLDAIPGDFWNGFTQRVTQCAALGKPLFVGETGIVPDAVGGTFAARAALFDAKLSAQFAAGAVGELVWAWSVLGSTTSTYDIGPGDPVLAVLGSY